MLRFPVSPLEFSEIGYLLLQSRDMAERSLNRRKSTKQPTNKMLKDYSTMGGTMAPCLVKKEDCRIELA